MHRLYFSFDDFRGYTLVDKDDPNFIEIDTRFLDKGYPYVDIDNLSEIEGKMYDGMGGLIDAPPLPEDPVEPNPLPVLIDRIELLEQQVAALMGES